MALQKGEGRYEIIHRRWSVVARADEIDAYVTQPDAVDLFGAVVVVQDVWGAVPQLREFAKFCARMGYVTAVPDLYSRLGETPGSRDDADWLAGTIPDGRMVADVEDTISFLDSIEVADTRRVALAGFGLGGRLATVMAAAHPGRFCSVLAVSPTLGPVGYSDGSVRPSAALDVAGNVDCPVLALFGEADATVTAAEVEKLAAALGPNGTIVKYPGAGRDFLVESSPDYDAAAANDAYERVLTVLDATVGSPKR